nr:GDNF-inducible zinc finger protein 1-like [Lepeophtheirus salmonis]
MSYKIEFSDSRNNEELIGRTIYRMKGYVTLGHYGDIGSLLSGDNSHHHSDLSFICKDGIELRCHRFIIGAQSKFLKTLLLNIPGPSSPAFICLPDVESKYMKIVLRFLYSGNLVIDGEDVPDIRYLITKILCLNARVCLPMDEEEFESSREKVMDVVPEELDSNKMYAEEDAGAMIFSSESWLHNKDITSSFENNHLDEDEEEEYKSEEGSLTADSTAEKNLFIYRGNWVKEIPTTRKRRKKVRKYSFCPFTITGVYKPSTLEALNQKSGSYTCNTCDITYDKEASLRRHISRTHNTNLREQCPECGKRLSTKSTLNKHLISHRPRSQWPFECPLCKQEFQCKADIPKHLMTSKHKDQTLPPMGSSEWIDLINSSARKIDYKGEMDEEVSESEVTRNEGNVKELENGDSLEKDPLSM